MSGPYTTLSAEVAEMSRIHYQLEYTEGISQRMRIPDTIKVALGNPSESLQFQQPLPIHTTMMQVPERIIVAGDDGDSDFSRTREFDLIQSIPPMDLDMKAPPTNPSQVAHFHPRSRRERSASENIHGRHSCQSVRGDVSVTPSPSAPPVRLCPPLCSPEDAHINLFTAAGFMYYIQSTTRRAYQQVIEGLDDTPRRSHLELALDMNPEESGLMDASSLRRQIVKLNRRLQLLEEENKERSKREVILYSATVTFWLINTWIWLRR
ncbi:hypothetical protein CgunFtcFv8_022888 [Champsocephalus gunnari]|uniref:Mitochondrial fission factor n=1 Tax=Champsocephalus gunnari TaxID=52237 RepID=A0AAN8DBB1_CHAGU|nr:hypothetical protein CgunFtcFv8_022888 [Champsocephalus gunnari]